MAALLLRITRYALPSSPTSGNTDPGSTGTGTRSPAGSCRLCTWCTSIWKTRGVGRPATPRALVNPILYSQCRG